MLHDVGKISIPKAILHKPSALTHTEFEVIKMHPVWGVELLAHNPHVVERARGAEPEYLDALVKEVLRIRPPLPTVSTWPPWAAPCAGMSTTNCEPAATWRARIAGRS